jgi:hypothetical protein
MEIIIQDQGLVQVEVSQDSLKTYLVVATLNKLIILIWWWSKYWWWANQV